MWFKECLLGERTTTAMFKSCTIVGRYSIFRTLVVNKLYNKSTKFQFINIDEINCISFRILSSPEAHHFYRPHNNKLAATTLNWLYPVSRLNKCSYVLISLLSYVRVFLVVLCEAQAWIIDKITSAAVEAPSMPNPVQAH